VVVNFDTVRVNVSPVYVLIISDFFTKPFHQCQELFVDHQTSVNDSNVQQTVDRTDGCDSSTASSPMTISARLKQCEVVLFAEPTKANSRVLLIQVLEQFASYIYMRYLLCILLIAACHLTIKYLIKF